MTPRPLRPYLMRRPPKPVKRQTADDPPDPRIPRPPPHIFTAAEIIRRITRRTALTPRLVGIDRHMQRWAVGQGSGFPEPERAMYRVSKLTPLPPEIDIATDQVVLRSPDEWRHFIVRWYRSDCSVDQLAAEMGMGRESLYRERKTVLAYLLGALTARGIPIATFE